MQPPYLCLYFLNFKFVNLLSYCLFLQVSQLHGVLNVQEPHFWTLGSNYYVGGLKLEVSSDADAKYIVSHTQMIFR